MGQGGKAQCGLVWSLGVAWLNAPYWVHSPPAGRRPLPVCVGVPLGFRSVPSPTGRSGTGASVSAGDSRLAWSHLISVLAPVRH